MNKFFIHRKQVLWLSFIIILRRRLKIDSREIGFSLKFSRAWKFTNLFLYVNMNSQAHIKCISLFGIYSSTCTFMHNALRCCIGRLKIGSHEIEFEHKFSGALKIRKHEFFRDNASFILMVVKLSFCIARLTQSRNEIYTYKPFIFWPCIINQHFLIDFDQLFV